MVSRPCHFSHEPKRQLLALHLPSRSFLDCVPSMLWVPCLLAKEPRVWGGQGSESRAPGSLVLKCSEERTGSVPQELIQVLGALRQLP